MAEKTNIIITGSSKGSRSAWMTSRALLTLFGLNTKFLHPDNWDKNTQMDGLLLTGGVDIDPDTFHTYKHPSIKKTEPLRDAMELFLLERALTQNIPVMGICRGMQLINLFMGGSLHPHIQEMDLEFKHPHSLLPLNTIKIEPRSHLHKILKAKKLQVNALHHQTLKTLGKGLKVAAKDTNGLIQAIETDNENFILGLQWHPEFMPYHWSTYRIFEAFSKEIKIR